eukprot:4084411-Amphidinium_carterae.1
MPAGWLPETVARASTAVGNMDPSRSARPQQVVSSAGSAAESLAAWLTCKPLQAAAGRLECHHLRRPP